MTFIFYLYHLIDGFLKHLKKDHVGAYASQAALFMIMAIFPLLMLILTSIRYTPVTEEMLFDVITNLFPSSFHQLANNVIQDLYHSANGTLLSFSIIITIWSASKGILSLINGFNTIYHIEEKRNYLILRMMSALYTVILVVGIVIMLTLLVFGNTLLELIHQHIPLIYDVAKYVIDMRNLYAPIIMTIIFLFIYKLVPNGYHSLLSFLPGALFSSLGWIIFSYGYSLYVDHFAGMSYSYGSITTLLLLVLWFYICMYIIFIGAEINIYFHKHFQFLLRKLKRKVKKSNI